MPRPRQSSAECIEQRMRYNRKRLLNLKNQFLKQQIQIENMRRTIAVLEDRLREDRKQYPPPESKWKGTVQLAAQLTGNQFISVPVPAGIPPVKFKLGMRGALSMSNLTCLTRFSIRSVGLAIKIKRVGSWAEYKVSNSGIKRAAPTE